MSALHLEAYAKTLLKWFDLDPEHPAWDQVRKRGGKVSLLSLCYPGKEPNELSCVCQLSNDGLFWTLENNPMIVCRRWTGKKFKSLAEAKDDAYAWTLSEVIRTIKAVMEFKYEVMSTFKKRDIVAFGEYLKKALLTVIFKGQPRFKDSFKLGFKAGVDWILRSEGVIRRPAWATYLVQNRDGSQTWFEHEPKPDHTEGKWLCSTGRHQNVQAHPESWTGSLRKLK